MYMYTDKWTDRQADRDLYTASQPNRWTESSQDEHV